MKTYTITIDEETFIKFHNAISTVDDYVDTADNVAAINGYEEAKEACNVLYSIYRKMVGLD